MGEKTYIMGILNITPDSFSDGGMFEDPKKAVEHAEKMQSCGADVIDIGAQSTRPGSTVISPEDEIKRLEPVLNEIKAKVSVPLSVDTFYPKVARFALLNGISIINDVSGILNAEMAETIKAFNAGWIITHTGADACGSEVYKDDIVKEVKRFFTKAEVYAKNEGIKDDQLCFDMGIGFGKTTSENIKLLQNIADLKSDERSMITALSRKRVIGECTGEQDPKERLFGTISANTAAIANGTDFLRVHDVAESVQAAKMADAIYRGV
jgi:dihydropteroate synthase